MEYVRIQTPETVVEHAASILLSHLLSGERVTWLLSGGSAIDLEVRIAQALQTHDTSQLYIGLIDERYGLPGHPDENYTQLMDAGFSLYVNRVLSGKSAEETAEEFGANSNQALRDADFSLGMFGIGADGHTAGIKPRSPAATSAKPALSYQWDDYQRITLTPAAISQIDEALIYAVGPEKADTLHTLLYQDASINDQPAQVLKMVKTGTLYTDIAL